MAQKADKRVREIGREMDINKGRSRLIKDRSKHKTLELNNSPAACGSEKPE